MSRPKICAEVLWTKDLVLHLISTYEMYPNLYDAAHPDYMNQVKRSAALSNISGELKIFAPGVTSELIKRKLHSLRGQYIRELRAEKKFRETNDALEDVFEPRLWCFGEMEFLRIHCKTKAPFPNNQEEKNTSLDDTNGMSNSSESTSRHNSSESTSRHKENPNKQESKKTENSDTKRKASELLEKCEKMFKTAATTTRDDEQIFGDYVASTLRNLVFDKTKKRLKLLIQRSIVEIQEIENECYESDL